MLRFLDFIILEANMSSVGDAAEVHASRYITPFIRSSEPTHSTVFGSRVFVHGHKIINGIYHAVVSSSKKGKRKLIPFNKIIKPKAGYSDERAISALWNHSVANKKHESLDSMNSDIDLAEKDENHPLSFQNASRDGFLSKDKNASGAKDAYFSELRNAAHTVKALSGHPDVKQKIESGDFNMANVGTSRGILSQLYTNSGVSQKSPASTSKTDLVIGSENPVRLTVKKSKSSQLSSSGSSDFLSMVKHSSNRLREHGHIDDEKHNQILSLASEISEIQKRGKQNLNDQTHQDNLNQANEKIKQLVSMHPKFNEYFRREALTGEGKFDSDLHKPTHIITHGEGSRISTTDEHDYSGTIPMMSRGKGGSTRQREYVIRLREQ